MRSFVTGGCGFVGPHLINYLRNDQQDYVGASFKEHSVSNTQDITTYKLDLLNYEAVRSALLDFRPNKIFHLAGLSFVPEAEENFKKALHSNVLIVDNILRICVNDFSGSLRPKFIMVSSGEVYGRKNSASHSFNEESELMPENSYSLTKVMAEQVVKKYSNLVDSVILRPFNHIGPGQNERFVASSFAKQLALIAKGKAENKINVGNLEALRDFTDVRDIVRGYHLASANCNSELRIFNLCSGQLVSIGTILNKLIKISEVNPILNVTADRFRSFENPKVLGSSKLAYQHLGWKPTIPLEQSLKDIYNEWYRAI